MPRIQLDAPAPNFKLMSYADELIELATFRNRANVLLVFNRGFA
jgi:peroxiredoxin